MKIILTGGGTAGHVTPNIALLPELRQRGFEIIYIGSKDGIEKKLMEDCEIKYYPISSGKLRRYIDFQNVKDAFKVIKGVGEAKKIIKKEKPDIIFSKGGFVSVPVVMAGWVKKIPVVIHESDITPGLANKMAAPFAKAVCTTFPEALKYVPKNKGRLTGTPIRKELFSGSKSKGLGFTKLSGDKPIILVMGGSSGSVKINETVHKALPILLKDYDVVHLCGKGNLNKDLETTNGYAQYEYLSGELPDIIAMANIVISRAGSNAICEFLALKKPCLLIPLSKSVSRGDQILNAKSFEGQGFSRVLEEEKLDPDTLVKEATLLYQDRGKYIEAMSKSEVIDGVSQVMKIIMETWQRR